MSKQMVIYPSSWYYNACVHGFLEVLAWGLGEEGHRVVEKQFLQNDGRVIIPADLVEAIFSDDSIPMPVGYQGRPVPDELKGMKRIAWWWSAVGYAAGYMRNDDRGKSLSSAEIVHTVCGKLFHKDAAYGVFAQPRWDKVRFLDTVFTFDKCDVDVSIICSFCGKKYAPTNVTAQKYKPGENRMIDVLFTRSLSVALGSTPKEQPNKFWDGNPSLTVCKSCRLFFLCFHITQNQWFFVNSDSLQINWHLNRLLSRRLKRNEFVYQSAILKALLYDPQLRRGISGWGQQNFEIIVLEKNKTNKIKYYPLSPRLAKMFLVPQISSGMSRLSNQKLWEVILQEQFDYLSIIIYKSLRVYLSKKNLGDDPEIVYDPSSIQPVFDLVTLYAEIIRFLSKGKGGKNMDYINTGQLRKLGAMAPLAQDDNLVFRLLELTRLNRKADVYHLLLRVYVSRGMEFPSAVAKVFSLTNPEMFKTGIYAYISGLRAKDVAKVETN